jgi:transcriptional regulator with XRE-family HTH domain
MKGGGAMFRKLRKRAGLKQVGVAKHLDVSQSTVSQWETRETHPRADLLPKIAKLYNCTVDDLLTSE